eukprot:5625602-Prymnesium_polylepis.1
MGCAARIALANASMMAATQVSMAQTSRLSPSSRPGESRACAASLWTKEPCLQSRVNRVTATLIDVFETVV